MRKIILTLLFLSFALCGWSQQYRYVKAGTEGTGSSWSDSSGDLQAMINASASGDEVWVAEGTYQPDAGQWFYMKEGVKIYGGFPSDDDYATMTERNWSLHPSILKGNGHSVIRNVFTSGSKMTNASVLDGFTVRDGLYYGSGSSFSGGGIYNAYASPTLINLIIMNNRAYAGGGVSCEFNSSPIIINTLISENSSNSGNGLYCVSSKGISHPILINVTMVKGAQKKGVRLNKGSTVTIYNSVIHDLSSFAVANQGLGYQIYNSYIQNLTTADAYGNINGLLSPDFNSYSSGDYMPSAISPLVDAGKNSYYAGSVVDISGNPRIYGSKIDVGAFEFQGTTCTDVLWDGTSWSGAIGLDKHLVVNGDLTISDDLEGCSMTVNSGNVVVQGKKTLSLLNEIIVIGGSFRLNPTASLVQFNDVVNTGDIFVWVSSKPMDKSNHGYWSSPVLGYKMNQFSPNTPFNSYYTWNLTSQAWITQPGGNVVMQPGHGYSMRAPLSTLQIKYNLNFNGVPNNGDINRTIEGGGKWNFLGNPYPSAINIDEFLYDPDNSGLDKLVYLWTNGYEEVNGY